MVFVGDTTGEEVFVGDTTGEVGDVTVVEGDGTGDGEIVSVVAVVVMALAVEDGEGDALMAVLARERAQPTHTHTHTELVAHEKVHMSHVQIYPCACNGYWAGRRENGAPRAAIAANRP